MLPTIVVWITQWKLLLAPLSVAALLAPGAISPMSADPSSITMWCVTVSLFLKVTEPPWLTITGFGVNDWLPVEPMIDTVAALGVEFVGVVLDGAE
jgi:hypothetical protein